MSSQRFSQRLRLTLGAGLGLLLLLAGCATQPTAQRRPAKPTQPSAPAVEASLPAAAPTPATAPAPALSAVERIDRILQMQQAGAISAEQAGRLLAVLAGEMPPPPPPPAAAGTPAAAPAPAPVAAPVVPGLSSYHSTERLAGRLRSVGSDSMDRMMEDWGKGFMQHHPALQVIHEGKGSSTAVPALIEDRSDLGPMSRPLKSSEIEKFRTHFGYPPIQLPVAIDALAVFVHPSNPVAQTGLTMAQVDAIFSATRRRGAPAEVLTWGQLGVTGPLADRPIRVYTRNTASGTYGLFKDIVLQGGDFKPTNTEFPGSAELVAAVAKDPAAIGFSGIGYRTPDVATVALMASPGQPAVEPSEETARKGLYPLARELSLVVNRRPGQPLRAQEREFLSFVFSEAGLAVVRKEGYFPLSPEQIAEQMARLQ